MVIERIQQALRDAGVDGWLFFDHHRRDPLAYKILQLPDGSMATRRWYYLVPAQGTPQKLVHRIESGALDTLPGEKHVYSSWTDQRAQLRERLQGLARIAMQYSPNCAIPYVSFVDGGTLELVRAQGVEVVSSADLVQQFETPWSDEQLELHLEAGRRVDRVRRDAFEWIGERLRSGVPVSEFDVQQFIHDAFEAAGLFHDHGPIVAVNANASDPHYEPSRERTAQIQRGDLVLIDLWAKLAQPDAVYYDVTWVGHCGASVPQEVQQVFEIVRDARKRGSGLAIERVREGRPLAGFEVDDAVRGYIAERGYAEYFVHRTGHSIGTDVHGTGANMDNLESHDERRIIPRTCFSIEPGIYLPHFGIRSEVNVYAGDGFARVTGEEQEQIVRIAC